jgi:hypothetical protein
MSPLYSMAMPLRRSFADAINSSLFVGYKFAAVHSGGYSGAWKLAEPHLNASPEMEKQGIKDCRRTELTSTERGWGEAQPQHVRR